MHVNEDDFYYQRRPERHSRCYHLDHACRPDLGPTGYKSTKGALVHYIWNRRLVSQVDLPQVA